MVLLLFTWNLSPRVRPFLDRKMAGTDQETGLLYSHDPWADWGPIWLGIRQHVAGHVPPRNQLQTTHFGPPQLAIQTARAVAHTYRANDTVRWPKWNLDWV